MPEFWAHVQGFLMCTYDMNGFCGLKDNLYLKFLCGDFVKKFQKKNKLNFMSIQIYDPLSFKKWL